MCKTKTPKIEAPAPPPAPPPVLEQTAPDMAKDDKQAKKKKGFSDYKVKEPVGATTAQLGGIPKRKAV